MAFLQLVKAKQRSERAIQNVRVRPDESIQTIDEFDYTERQAVVLALFRRSLAVSRSIEQMRDTSERAQTQTKLTRFLIHALWHAGIKSATLGLLEFSLVHLLRTSFWSPQRGKLTSWKGCYLRNDQYFCNLAFTSLFFFFPTCFCHHLWHPIMG